MPKLRTKSFIVIGPDFAVCGSSSKLRRLCVDTLFLDLGKAFDKVPYQRLMEKLRKHGIGGKLLRTIGNWLSKRRQRVCVKGV